MTMTVDEALEFFTRKGEKHKRAFKAVQCLQPLSDVGLG